MMVTAAGALVPAPESGPEPGTRESPEPFDETAESAPDSAATLAQEFAKRAAVVVLAQQSQQQMAQAHLDRLRANFNAEQEERSEALREMNALRDMAMEQAKKDDEILKKYIAMI